MPSGIYTTTKKRGRPKIIKEEPIEIVKVFLTVLGETAAAEGKTVFDAIMALKPKNGKGKGNLMIVSRGKKFERFLNQRIMYRMFAVQGSTTAEIAKSIFAKNMQIIFKGNL